MPSSHFGKFGPLIGVIIVSNTHCRFLIYTTQNAEVLTFHEIKLRQIMHNAGWLEFDPMEIWKNTQICIETVYNNLIILEIDPYDIIAVGICNQRGTTVLWERDTGNVLHNAIGWNDCRATPILKTILKNVKFNVDCIRPIAGVPLSTCFSAFKIKWLQENNAAVTIAMENENCMFGTLDSWILWNLTGSVDCGVHSTDVTNASYTALMNVQTLQWDRRLCDFFRIPIDILPRICTNSEVFGYIIGGPLNGLPIASCIGEQPATILGQLSLKKGQNVCIIDDSCYLLVNTGAELIESENGLITSIAYKLGRNASVCYTLEGAISNAGSTVEWLKEKVGINTEMNNTNDNVVEALTAYIGESSMISSSCSSSILNAECGLAAKRSEITFVPAFHGLYAPYWRYDAKGILLGLTSQTTADNITQAAYEATGFQIKEILEAFKLDTPKWDRSSIKDVLIISGEYAENNIFLQFVTDIVGCLFERPQTISPSGLGTMIAAGITMSMVSLKNAVLMYIPPADPFTPATTANRRELLYKRWAYAVKKCLCWNNYETFESDLAIFSQRELDPNSSIRYSLPGSIFLTGTFVLLVVAQFLQGKGIK